MAGEKAYNPLDKMNLAQDVARALLEKPVAALPPEDEFTGAGIYAIYYAGDFDLYAPLARANQGGKWALPIYVGKAIPQGGRKGGIERDAVVGSVLHGRLRQHAKSIESCANLKLADFRSRYLVLDEIWVPLAENLLISRFNPLWNTLVEGFGNHDPGAGRYEGKMPLWDLLHPGRPWTAKCQKPKMTLAELKKQVVEFLKK